MLLSDEDKATLQRTLVERYVKTKGHLPRLDPPVSFNEHVLHRIIHDRDPRLKIICDKLAVRRFIASRVGAGLVVPLLGVWSSADDILWEQLPATFVLKPNHASGMVAIVRRARPETLRNLVPRLQRWLTQDHFAASGEWGYLGLPRRLIAEPLLTGPDGTSALEVQIQVVRGRTAHIGLITGVRGQPSRYGDWFYPDGTRHPGRRRAPLRHDPLPAFVREQVVPVAEHIARDFIHLRVDFYVTAEGLKIGELTPYPGAGRANFDPPELDEELGASWTAAPVQPAR